MTTTPDLRGLHEKALLEATLFGLPMLGVTMIKDPTVGAGAPIDPVEQPAVNGTDLGLATYDLHLTPTSTEQTKQLRNPPYDAAVPTFTTARWLTGPGGATVTNPAEPALPLTTVNATSTDANQVLRGVGFRGGSYTDTAGIVPLTGAPTTELRGVHAPFVSPVFYPMRLWNPNYYGELGDAGGTNLLVTPVQHKTDNATAGTSIQRKFTALDLKLFYSSKLGGAALSDAPTIVSVEAQTLGADIAFTAQVIGDPNVAMREAWITYTGGTGTWASLDLVQCVTPLPIVCGTTDDSRIWKGLLTGAPANLQYVVQAANGLGLVAFDDNRGAYYKATASGAPAVPATTTLLLISPPSGGTFGDSPSITAELKQGSTLLVGKPVSITIGGTGAVGVTGSNGRVTLPVALNSTPGTTQVTASFGGDDAFAPADDVKTPFTIAKATATLTPFTVQAAVVTAGANSRLTTTLQAQVGGKTQVLGQETVTFTLTGPTPKTYSTITDYLGRATVPTAGLSVGTYAVTATFPGNGTYTNAVRTGSLVISSFSGFLFPVAAPPKLNIAKAPGIVPLRFSLGGNLGLGILAAGSPTATKVACPSGATSTVDQAGTFPKLGLVYLPLLKQYLYVWTVPKTYAGSCYRLDLTLADGSTYSANFKFK